MICDNMQQGQWTHACWPMPLTNPTRYRCCNAKPVGPGAGTGLRNVEPKWLR